MTTFIGITMENLKNFMLPALLALVCTISASSATINLGPDGSFQAALNQANPGDTIVLAAGATYTGNFTLPNKPGYEYITIRSSALDSLPPENVRVDPSYAQYMPKLVSPNHVSVVTAADAAHHYRFVGIEIHPAAGMNIDDIVRIGLGKETNLGQLPHDLVFDRVYIHGDPTVGSKRGIALNGKFVTVINSYISDIKLAGFDTQTICGWNGPGPFHIINNYLEASGENIMFGGALARIPNLVPSDIEIRHNYFCKPLSWRIGDPSYAGRHWTVKNLLELKNAQRVTIEGNVFEYCWADGQYGEAITFTPRTEGGAMAWAVVQDVTFTNNIIRHASDGLVLLGVDNTDPVPGIVRLHRILVENNLWEDISSSWAKPGVQGFLFLILAGTDAVTINHNTGFSDRAISVADIRQYPSTNFVFTNNVFPRGQYGFWGSGEPEGNPTLAMYFPGAVFSGNALIGAKGSLYPDGNFFPASLEAFGRPVVSSRYRNAGTDGKDIGADLDAIKAATRQSLPANARQR